MKRSKPDVSPPRESLARVIAEWSSAIAIYLFVSASLVQGNVIPTGSMEPTLLVGDHVLVDRSLYARADGVIDQLLPHRDVRRGDVIVFRYPLDENELYVKRAAAGPGDRLRIVDGRLFVNGAPAEEPYKIHRYPSADPYAWNFPPTDPAQARLERGRRMLELHVQDGDLIVPADSWFALGDNRDNSEDSRYWGFVPRENIVGTPAFVYWSYDASTDQLLDRLSIRHLADLGLHFFSRTRWERTFARVRSVPQDAAAFSP